MSNTKSNTKASKKAAADQAKREARAAAKAAKALLAMPPVAPAISADAGPEAPTGPKQHNGPVRLSPDHTRYNWHHTVVKGAVYDNGDAIAKALREVPLGELYDLVEAKIVQAGRPYLDLRAKYMKLNRGMQRMNLGNLLRGLLTPKAAASKATPAPAPKAPAKPDAKPAAMPLMAPPIETLD